MAIYHLNVRYCSKSKGQSAQAKNEYINRNDKYSKRLDDLQFSGFGNMPKFAENNPQKFWQASDIYERANARVCTEIVFALPRELNLEQQQELVQSFINSTVNSERNKLPYSFAIHNDKANNNPHCHLIFSERQLDGIERSEEQFFKRANSKNSELGGTKKTADFRDRDFIKAVRKTWSEQANFALEKHGHTARIDERSYQEQGIDKEPRARLDRVTWQELQRLEENAEFYGEVIERKQHQIEQEKAEIAQKENAEKMPQETFDEWLKATYEPLDERKEHLKKVIDRENSICRDEQKTLERLENENGYGWFGFKSSEQRQRIKSLRDEIANAEKSREQAQAELKGLEQKIELANQQRKQILEQYPHLSPNTYEILKQSKSYSTTPQKELNEQFKRSFEKAELKIREEKKNAQKRNLGRSTGGI